MTGARLRHTTVHGFAAVVLENDTMRVLVVPALGGRVWELEDTARRRQWIWPVACEKTFRLPAEGSSLPVTYRIVSGEAARFQPWYWSPAPTCRNTYRRLSVSGSRRS